MSKRALVSVSDKTNIVGLVQQLAQFDYQIISTGGTKRALEETGIAVIGVEEITEYPEMMDGRVKTLHPKVHGGLLALRDNQKHLDEMFENDIQFIDLVVVNLYPFQKTIETKGTTYEDAIENIDIGGPSMLRSAAKNHRDVTVICDPQDYEWVIDEIAKKGNTTLETRRKLAAKAFRHTAAYDAHIAQYLTEQVGETDPESITLTYTKKQALRYGENPHQKATFYIGKKEGYSLAWGEQLHGKELSYNNIQDGDAALNMVKEFQEPVCVAVKHKNPCGVGIGADLYEAWRGCYEADTTSIFGGIVATNQPIDKKTAEEMGQIFLEIILAPSFTPEAFEILSQKKNIRLITFDLSLTQEEVNSYISINGGLLAQTKDHFSDSQYDIRYVTEKKPTEPQLQDLLFGMKVCKHVKSNAITVVHNRKTVGIGAGQMNRVGAARIALEQAKNSGYTQDLILASDAFFPFDDVVELAHQYGVAAIIQPGGSLRDEDSIKACNKFGISMIFTRIRHFKH